MDTYYAINNDNQDIEYIITIDDQCVTLKRSNSSEWASDVRNTVVLTVKDTGDGYKIKWEDKVGKMLDYAQAMELNIILSFLNKKQHLPMSYSFIDADRCEELV